MKGLRTAIYKVSDLQEAKKWYTSAFGKSPYFDEPFYVGFNIGGYELGLLPDDQSTGSEKPSSMLTYWGVDDIETDYKRLIELGGRQQEPPTNVGGDLMVASVYDPWGNPLGIIYNPHFSLDTQ